MSNSENRMPNILFNNTEAMESTSALRHVSVGICPKCKVTMGRAEACGEEVFFCTKCRVTEPLPESGC